MHKRESSSPDLTVYARIFNPLVSILPKVAPLTAYHFIASLLEMLFAHMVEVAIIFTTPAGKLCSNPNPNPNPT